MRLNHISYLIQRCLDKRENVHAFQDNNRKIHDDTNNFTNKKSKSTIQININIVELV